MNTDITKKIFDQTVLGGAVVFSALIFSLSSSAAVVTIDTPAEAGETSYTVPGDNTVYQIFQTDTPDGTIVDPSVNGGVEFILLGAHETIVHESNDISNNCIASGTCNDTITVTVNNANFGQQTQGVSLVLAGSESLIWNVTVTDPSIDVQSIFVFGSNQQTVIVNGVTVPQLVSADSVCAFSYPNADSSCQTDELLGIETDNNRRGRDNFLGELTDAQLTSFNGSYFADGFTVTIDSVAVPLPGAFILMTSALMGLCARKLA